MEQIIQFLNEWWQFLAIFGGAILLIVIIAAIVGRFGRKPVRRPAPKPTLEPAEPIEPEPVVAEDVPVPAIDPEPAVAPIVPLTVPAEPDPIPTPAPVTNPAAPAPITPAPLTANSTPEPEPVTAPAAETTVQPIVAEPPKPVKPKEPKPELGSYRVTYRTEDGKWLVTRDGSPKIMRTLETQTDAVNWATIKALTQNVELVVYKKDGTIKKPTNPPAKKAS